MSVRQAPRNVRIVWASMALCCALSALPPSPALADLHDPSNDYDYILLASDELLQAALPLAQHRQDDSPCGGGGGHRVLTVTTSEVYSEFSPGAEGIKDFLSYAYHNWAVPPKFVFLIGDANWDSTQSGDLIPSQYVFFDFGWGLKRIAWDDWCVCRWRHHSQDGYRSPPSPNHC